MSAIFKSGTLLIPSGTYHDPGKRHLFVICSDATAEQTHFLVSISTWRNQLCDGTCILEPGCHPFVDAKSYVVYRSARVETVATLAGGIQRGLFLPNAPLKGDAFDRVVDGILHSPQTPRKLQHYFKKKCS